VDANRITKKKKRFAIPIMANTFHKDSHPRISITDPVIGKLLKSIREPGPEKWSDMDIPDQSAIIQQRL
jgi:hypothetical protein